MVNLNSQKFAVYYGDISDEFAALAGEKKIVAWDIETSGLDWQKDTIGTCQLYVPEEAGAIVKIDANSPRNLISLLSDTSIKKVFHHAPFDLRSMSFHWKALPQNIACTKIAAKLLDPENKNKHDLKSLLSRYLNVEIDKNTAVRCSNWSSDNLTEAQLTYAMNDVKYLPALLKKLEEELRANNLLELTHACFAYIPTRVQLELRGYGDIYAYQNSNPNVTGGIT